QSTLAGWSGCDTVLGPQCTVVLTTSKTVTATFDPIPDTTTPAVTITAPTSGATYTTGNPALTLGGPAPANVGRPQVTWTNGLDGQRDRPPDGHKHADGPSPGRRRQYCHGHLDGDLHADLHPDGL